MTKVLVVDDEQVLRQLLREHLELEGFIVDEAESTLQATMKLSHHHFDLVLLDLHLPDKPGTEVLRFMTCHDVKAKVIVITGVHGLDTAIECMNFGAADYVPKPFEIEYLVSSINKALDQPMAA